MSFYKELKRRNVFRVTAAYLALGWIFTQVTGAVVPALHLPESIPSIVVWLGVIGFPFVVLFSWVYELTPKGLKRENLVDRAASITHVTSHLLNYIIIGMLEALRAWYAIASRADWGKPSDVRLQLRNASIISGHRCVFNIAGNKYRLIVNVNYPARIAFIRFIGTHRQYDKVDAETI